MNEGRLQALGAKIPTSVYKYREVDDGGPGERWRLG